ncbi:MAG TPA: thermonuclease family protein [Verrucomicrobiae bacterium]|nr:thermonuclease family protein [Verrucomicrobiae bacterium]
MRILIRSLLFLLCFSCVTHAEETLTVTRVVDGDSLKLSNGEMVRLIGIDTPESSMNSKLKRDQKRSGQDAKTIIRLGNRAKNFTRALVQGREVKLEFDVTKRDKYGRLLAFVYFPVYGTNRLFVKDGIIQNVDDTPLPLAKSFDENGTKSVVHVMLNAYLLQKGYAQVMTIPPNVKYESVMLALQRQARENGRGLWKKTEIDL